jgi:hypothetical protein
VKLNHYKAPRDKLICILNCCKVIFGLFFSATRYISHITVETAAGLIRHMNSEESADTFVPILIYVVLKANPENLLSNVEYVYSSRKSSTYLTFTGSSIGFGTHQSYKVRPAITCPVWYVLFVFRLKVFTRNLRLG